MKQTAALRSLFFLVCMNVFTLLSWAQDSSGGSETKTTTTTTKTTNVTTTEWYTQPWVWIIGAAVFILLLVALLNSNKNSRTAASTTDRITVKKTVERDTDTN